MTEWSVAWPPTASHHPLTGASTPPEYLFTSPRLWTGLTGDNDPSHIEVFTSVLFNTCHYSTEVYWVVMGVILLQDAASSAVKNTGAVCLVSIRLGVLNPVVLKAYFVVLKVLSCFSSRTWKASERIGVFAAVKLINKHALVKVDEVC